MNSRASVWLPLVLVGALAALSFWLNDIVQGARVKPPGPPRHDPDYIVGKFVSHQLAADGSLHYTLSARKMIHYADDDATRLEQVEFAAFEPGQPPVKVVSDFALLTSKADEVFFSGDVLLRREAVDKDPPLTIRTTYLHAVPETGMVDTDRAVVANQGADVVNAAAMTLNSKTRLLELTHVKATYRPVASAAEN